MNPFTITLTQPQANLIFNALQTHVQKTQEIAQDLIRYIDGEFLKSNPQMLQPTPAAPDATAPVDEAKTEQPENG